MRTMGTLAGAPLEPPEQTRLLDASQARPGVLAGGVPGAGGYDAIWLFVLDGTEGVTDAVEAVWAAWTEMDVCPLAAAESRRGGLIVEDLDNVPGLRAAVYGSGVDA